MWVTPYLPCSRGCEECGIIVNYLSNPQCSNYSFEDKFLLKILLSTVYTSFYGACGTNYLPERIV